VLIHPFDFFDFEGVKTSHTRSAIKVTA